MRVAGKTVLARSLEAVLGRRHLYRLGRFLFNYARREKRAKIIHADGEFQAALQLTNAADQMAKNSMTLQLRYLQTLTEIGSERNSVIVFPVPIELLSGLLPKAKDRE